MVLATWWDWGDVASIVLAICSAFFFGYGLLASLPLLRSGMSLRQGRAARLRFRLGVDRHHGDRRQPLPRHRPRRHRRR